MAITARPILQDPASRSSETLVELRPKNISAPGALVSSRRNLTYLAFKRALDVALSLLLLTILSPLWLLIAVCIRLDSKGPILFKQSRAGQNRRHAERRSKSDGAPADLAARRKRADRRQGDLGARPFIMYKFRTMRDDCDSSPHRQFMERFIRNEIASDDCAEGSEDAPYKLNHDPRVTRVGRILRKTSLDELPQLINVLKGDMSLIGPRPALPYEVQLYRDWHRERLRVLPGITGWWQVQGRSRVPFDQAVQMDIYYADHCGPLLDLKILLLTPWAMISGEGAE